MNKKTLPIALLTGVFLIIGIAVFINSNRKLESPIVAPEVQSLPKEKAKVQTNQFVAETQEVYEMEQEEVLFEVLPAKDLIAEEALAPEVEIAKVALEPTEIIIHVVEEGTGMPLPRVRVTHEFIEPADPNEVVVEEENNDRRGFGGGRGGRGGPGRNQDRQEVRTNEGGIATLVLENDENIVASLDKNLPVEFRATWGVGPRHTSEQIKLIPNTVNELTIEYPARTIHTVRLMDEMENPVASYDMKLNVQQYDWWEGDIFFSQEVKTNTEGIAEFLAYEQRRSMLQVEVADVALFKSEQGRGTEQGNPLSLRIRIDEEEQIEIVLLQDVVRVNARLLNEPTLRAKNNRLASVEAVDSEVDIDYMMVPIEDRDFSFSVPVGVDVEVYITQRQSMSENTDRRNAWRAFSESPSVELKQVIEIPDTAGEIDVDLVYPDRRFITAKVYLPDGEPADDIEVRALGFGDSPLSEGTPAENDWRARRDQALGRIDGESSIVSEPTDSNGITKIELPPADSYIFEVEPDTLPDDAKGREPIEMTWAEIESKGEVIITLLPSSLLWGEVVDWNGEPVANATVYLRGPDIPRNDELFRTQTDNTGFFELNVPPVRLLEPDPEEPPEYYVFANANNRGGGLGQAIIDNPDEPVFISINPFAELQVEVRNNGEIVNKIEFEQLYDVPGFTQQISARNSGPKDDDRDNEGSFTFTGLIEEISSVNIFSLDPNLPPNVFTILITDEVAENNHILIDFANTDGSYSQYEEPEGEQETAEGSGGGGRGQGGGRGRGGF